MIYSAATKKIILRKPVCNIISTAVIDIHNMFYRINVTKAFLVLS